jgi:hypothetical protein
VGEQHRARRGGPQAVQRVLVPASLRGRHGLNINGRTCYSQHSDY